MTTVPSDATIAVLEVGITVGEEGAAHPTVVLDVAHRPDVADLPRVHAVEGVGDIVTLVDATDDGLVLTVRLTRPVIAEFAVRFLLPEHLEVLGHAALVGHLLLATTPPAAAGDNPVWLAVDLDGPGLAAVLVAHPRVR
jgi:hypothetical protein